MGQTFGDGIVAIAMAAAFLGWYYFKHRATMRRLEILHQERTAAMEKGIPLPELPLDPPKAPDPHTGNIPLILGILLLSLGAGLMIALRLIPEFSIQMFWPLPLPFALAGAGLLLYHFLSTEGRR